MSSIFFGEFIAMDTKHTSAQPQDPVAAKLGNYIARAGIVAAVLIAAISFLRG